ncbi:two-component regulator propeller domain-containing protein [uncultured Psychroserpens sp.]|uniref:ligand-binding sensor domain-containing protein n=1 Tax=uncultured Psychroserpens sp. TaxID=255436 RepID=UPI0026244750|nr:two-component regulator propeller domain-containing protein [uncultured Psychroserpens sp.]
MKLLIITCLLIGQFVSSQNVQFVNQPIDSINAKEIRSLFQDSKQAIWLGTKSQGIFRLKNKQLQKMIVNNESALTGFISVLEETEGSILFSGRGVMRFKDDSITMLSDKDGIKSNVIFSISKLNDDSICFSGNKGSDCIEKKTIKHFNTINGLKHQVVHDVKKDVLGQLWFATRKGGLNMLDKNGEWYYFLEATNCRKLFKLKNGNIWIGTSTGAVLLNVKKRNFEVFEKGFALIPQVETDNNIVVFATENNGIFTYKNKAWKQFNTKNSILKSNVIHSIIEDSNNELWFGFDKGIQVLKYSDLHGN